MLDIAALGDAALSLAAASGAVVVCTFPEASPASPSPAVPSMSPAAAPICKAAVLIDSCLVADGAEQLLCQTGLRPQPPRASGLRLSAAALATRRVSRSVDWRDAHPLVAAAVLPDVELRAQLSQRHAGHQRRASCPTCTALKGGVGGTQGPGGGVACRDAPPHDEPPLTCAVPSVRGPALHSPDSACGVPMVVRSSRVSGADAAAEPAAVRLVDMRVGPASRVLWHPCDAIDPPAAPCAATAVARSSAGGSASPILSEARPCSPAPSDASVRRAACSDASSIYVLAPYLATRVAVALSCRVEATSESETWPRFGTPGPRIVASDAACPLSDAAAVQRNSDAHVRQPGAAESGLPVADYSTLPWPSVAARTELRTATADPSVEAAQLRPRSFDAATFYPQVGMSALRAREY